MLIGMAILDTLNSTVAIVALLITILTSLVIIAYHAGVNSNRIQNLEQWKIEVESRFDKNLSRIEKKIEENYIRLENLIRQD